MPKNNTDNDISFNEEGSSLAQFTRRSLPTDEEMAEFEEYIEEEAKDEEIDESLEEIYQDENGRIVDVKKLDKRKRRGFLFWFFSFVIVGGLLAGGGYYIYNFIYLGGGSDATAVEFFVEGKNEVAAGEEFFYTIQYRNTSNIPIRDIRVEVNFPEHFIFLDSFPDPSDPEMRNVWTLPRLAGNQNTKIRVKGMLMGEKGDTGVLVANLIYTPENFSSEFRKESVVTTAINSIGLDINADYISSALVGQKDDILFHIQPGENNFLNDFRLSLEMAENIELLEHDAEDFDDYILAQTEMLRPGVWQIKGAAGDDEQILPIRFRFTSKTADRQELKFNFEYLGKNNQYYTFYSKALEFEVMKSDLNLTLIVNGSREDQGVDLGQTLHYSLVYSNRGETDMKDVVIMAVLESEFLDWTTLEDNLLGRERGNTITWSKEEIPELELLERNEEGTIDFTIDIVDSVNPGPGKEYQVKSFAQFTVGEAEDAEVEIEIEDNTSNTIISRINSDLKLSESLRYFNEDNIPVGTGPHPPKVGEETSYKVYWDLENNLHELNDLKVEVDLPEGVVWDNKNRSTIGSLKQEGGKVIWNIGRLPITVFEASAEFNVKVTPTENDRNKIMVVLPGATATAVDTETESEINLTTKAQTTKLEDDDIAQGDGIIE